MPLLAIASNLMSEGGQAGWGALPSGTAVALCARSRGRRGQLWHAGPSLGVLKRRPFTA